MKRHSNPIWDSLIEIRFLEMRSMFERDYDKSMAMLKENFDNVMNSMSVIIMDVIKEAQAEENRTMSPVEAAVLICEVNDETGSKEENDRRKMFFRAAALWMWENKIV